MLRADDIAGSVLILNVSILIVAIEIGRGISKEASYSVGIFRRRRSKII